MNLMNRAQAKPTVFALWRHCRDLFVTQPAPSIWFDPRPNRRVRINTWRRFEPKHSATVSRRG